MRTFLLHIIWLVAITVSLSAAKSICDTKTNRKSCNTAEQSGQITVSHTEIKSTSATIHQTISKNKNDSKTAEIVAASLGTVVVVTLILLFFIIRRRVRITCVLKQKQSAEIKETNPSSKMHPDIEAASGDDSEYAEIYLDSLDPMKREDNVYQTIDTLPEQRTTSNEYDHLNENTLESNNKIFSYSVDDSQSETVVQDYGHIVKTKAIPGGYLTLETNKSDTSNGNFRMTKAEMTNYPNVMESTYNSTQHETNQAGTSNSDVGNYSHLHPESTHGLHKTMQLKEITTDSRCKADYGEPAISNPILVDEETGFCLKEADVEPNIAMSKEMQPISAVGLALATALSLTETDEENTVDHQYFVLEKIDK